MTEFTDKAKGITDIMEMVTGKARTEGECVWDKEDGYRTHNFDFDSVPPVYRKEYEISGMCITCQNGVFG